MTLYTVPDALPIPEPTDVIAPLDDRMEDQLVATQAALLRPGSVANAASRDAAIPAPAAGQSVYRVDLGWREFYYPVGQVRTAGWYPVAGAMPLMSATLPASQQVLNGSTSNLKFTTADVSRNVTYTLSTGVVTITQPGLYDISGYARMTNGVASALRLQVNVNGNPMAMQYFTQLTNVSIASRIVLSANDQVALTLANADSATAQVASSNRGMVVSYVGPA